MSREIATTTREHVFPDGRIHLLGAWRTVTGAMTRVDTAGGSLLVDCGVAQGRDAQHVAPVDEARDVEAVVLTHGHNDHVGSLPALLDTGFDGPIYGTRATLAIAEINLRDGIRLNGGSEADLRRFVARYQAQSRPLRYDTPHPIGPARVTLREAGHILGSASVALDLPKSRVVLSGDLGRPGTPLLRDFFTGWSAPVDMVVMESTYGSRDHQCDQLEARRQLAAAVRRAVAHQGHLLIPAFAIGRTQTILYHLNHLVEAREVPPTPVAVDTPMGIRVTELHAESTGLFDDEALARLDAGDDPLDFDALYAVRRGRDSHRLRELPGPMVIIAGSGMCTGGRIVRHLRDRLPHPETTVLLVGYQTPGTPGHALQRAAPGDTVHLRGEDVVVAAQVDTLSGLSAHAYRSELTTWLHSIPGHPRVALHHGDPESQASLAESLG